MSDIVRAGKQDRKADYEYGGEVYWRRGPFWGGAEFLYSNVRSGAFDDPQFLSGHVFGSYILTGESRDYDHTRGLFRTPIPENDVESGGIGLWEVGLRFSWLDLDDVPVQGGKANRITAAATWYATFDSRVTVNYGYVTLDRFSDTGHLHVMQARLLVMF